MNFFFAYNGKLGFIFRDDESKKNFRVIIVIGLGGCSCGYICVM